MRFSSDIIWDMTSSKSEGDTSCSGCVIFRSGNVKRHQFELPFLTLEMGALESSKVVLTSQEQESVAKPSTRVRMNRK